MTKKQYDNESISQLKGRTGLGYALLLSSVLMVSMAVNMLFLKFCQTQLMKLEKAMVKKFILRDLLIIVCKLKILAVAYLLILIKMKIAIIGNSSFVSFMLGEI